MVQSAVRPVALALIAGEAQHGQVLEVIRPSPCKRDDMIDSQTLNRAATRALIVVLIVNLRHSSRADAAPADSPAAVVETDRVNEP